jgi:CRP/FNR family cyclic AMP-dependent transcriptional regulator
MALQHKYEDLKIIGLFQGLDDAEIKQVANLCEERSFGAGELCQTEGQPSSQLRLITQGRVGTVVRIPSVTYMGNELILDTLCPGDAFGWSALIKGTPWSTLRALEPTNVMCIDADDFLKLCETNNHIGFILMRNLVSLVASRLKRNRMSILNTIVAMRSEW